MRSFIAIWTVGPPAWRSRYGFAATGSSSPTPAACTERARVIEALASGIPTVRTALAEAGVPPAHYVDAGIRFTVVLHRTAQAPRTIALNDSEQRVYDALAPGPLQVTELEKLLRLSAANIRKVLRALRGHGLIEQIGGRGRTTSYRRPPE
jgi:ATP-dependent DNA helicase RecG